MHVGVPKEIKDNEFRVGLTPSITGELVARGHRVTVERQAGAGAGFSDDDYRNAGAEIADRADSIFSQAELIVKVKEPLTTERKLLRRGQVLFTYLHLAPDPEQTKALMESGVVAIAYETVTDRDGRLPLLTPMSEVAGRMAAQIGAQYLERPHGGRGILLGGVPGVMPAEVLVIGSGTVGGNAALIASGMGAVVTVIAPDPDFLRPIAARFGTAVRTLVSTPDTVDALCRRADLVIGAALVPGATAPKVVKAETVKTMKRGAVIVDVAIDQGGNAETSRPTTHSHPTYIEHGVVHYCVTNMPGAVPRTSTFALTNATRPFVLALADKGWRKALAENSHLRNGLNVLDGNITHSAVAEALKLPYKPPEL
ncbi:MAG: alanine dehydrogenase [Alphaproteobacteria bacterium]|nr:alanine dehydrogenase [Alphaproteobacteria bacterium]